MPTLYIEEYDTMPRDANLQILPIVPDPVASHKVTIGDTSAQSAVMSEKTTFVRLIADTPCQYSIGTNPTATANSKFLPANVPIDRHIDSGQRIAVIAQQ